MILRRIIVYKPECITPEAFGLSGACDEARRHNGSRIKLRFSGMTLHGVLKNTGETP